VNAPTVYSLNRELTQAHVRLEVLQDDLIALRQRVIVPPLPEVDRDRLEDMRFARIKEGRKAAEHQRYNDLLLEFLKLFRQPQHTHQILCREWCGTMLDAAKNNLIKQQDGVWHITETGKQRANTLHRAKHNRERLDALLEDLFEVAP
jgi:hypothetical protein